MAIKKVARKKLASRKPTSKKIPPKRKLSIAVAKKKKVAAPKPKVNGAKSVVVALPEPFKLISEVVQENKAGEKSAKDKSSHYVDNKAFLLALVTYRREALTAVKKKQEKPRVPEYIGECFLRIATHLSFKLNFSNYMFREDMVSDGVENCLQYILNFDPAKSSNPFSYFTQIAYFAFLRRIKKEKKQLYIKLVSYENNKMLGDLDTIFHERHNFNAGRSETEFDRFAREFVENYETPKRERAPKKERGLEKIMDDEDE